MVRLLDTTDWVQCSVHVPSPFICTHRQHLLPTWQTSPQSVIIILQRCTVSLTHCTTQTEHQKDLLRDRFLHIGAAIRHHLHTFGHDAEIFDPKSGHPIISPPGPLHLDDVAVARQALQYAAHTRGVCTYLMHPQWKDAVYPATLVSDAPVTRVQAMLSTIVLSDEYPKTQSTHLEALSTPTHIQ